MKNIKTKISFTLILLACPLFVWAETVIYQNPLVFELDLNEPGVHESASIPVEFAVSEVTANWDSKGEVKAEVSADGGFHYTSVVNGVPKREGIAVGKQLRYKIHVAPGSDVSSLTLAYAAATGETYIFGDSGLSDFAFYRPVYISGSKSGHLFNYPVKINIDDISLLGCDDGSRDFKDIRFTAADARTQLPYYREVKKMPGKQENATVDFWVKVPQIPPSGVFIYVYYGNPEAGDESSGEDTFMFFDNFKDQAIDNDKWEFLPELNGQGRIQNKQLFLKDSSIIAKDFSAKPGYQIEFMAHSETDAVDIQVVLDDIVLYSSSFNGAEHAIAKNGRVKVNRTKPLEPGVNYIYSISGLGEEVEFTREVMQEAAIEQTASTKVTSSARFKDEDKEGFRGLALKSTTYDTDAGVYFDWVRVRPYVAEEPKVLSFGKQEQTNLAQISVGNQYISQSTSTDFPIRIMALRVYPEAKWTGLNWNVSLSATGGKSYLSGVVSGTHYYASKSDFISGQNIRLQIDMDEELKDKVPFRNIVLDYLPGTITIISPNGGESLPAGSKQLIRWSAQEYKTDYSFRLEFSSDGGNTYVPITETLNNVSSFLWQLPNDLEGKILIRLSDSYAADIFDITDDFIEIRSAMQEKESEHAR